MNAKRESSRVWRWRHAWAGSDLGPNTKSVLGMLGMRMDAEGGSCFPSISELVTLTGLDKKTVRKHVLIAERAGWLEIGVGMFSGQRWRRQSYRARWPDGFGGNGKVGEMAPKGGGIDAQKVGEPFPRDNNTPINSPDKRAGAQDGPVDRRKINAAFLAWLPTWPRYKDFSDTKAKRAWFDLAPEQRAACIALTPVFLRLADHAHLGSPVTYLRGRLWESITSEDMRPAEPERARAAYCGKLWMAWRFWLLLQPSQPVTLTAVERWKHETGRASFEEVMRARRRDAGWPEVNEMISISRQRDREFYCSTALMPLASAFVAVDVASDIFAAWRRLHDKRGWPFIDRPLNYVYFPALADLAGDLDGEVEAALAAFEVRAHEIMDGIAGAKEN